VQVCVTQPEGRQVGGLPVHDAESAIC
jgi:hypothetical protein